MSLRSNAYTIKIWGGDLYILIGAFIPFTFNVISHIFGFECTLLLFAFYMSHLFYLPFIRFIAFSMIIFYYYVSFSIYMFVLPSFTILLELTWRFQHVYLTYENLLESTTFYHFSNNARAIEYLNEIHLTSSQLCFQTLNSICI